jgi:hypothetical protein
MSLNGLTGSAGLKLGPLVLETLVKHYIERLVAQKIPTIAVDGVTQDGKQGGSTPNLRREELLYDQAFTIVKVSFVRVHSPGRTATLQLPFRLRVAFFACPSSFVFCCAS